MKVTRRAVSLAELLLGGLGVVISIAGTVGVWLLASRLSHVADDVFARIDSTLVAVQRTVGNTAERVHAARITADDVERGLKDWAKEATRDRLASKLDIEGKTERLETGLEQADRWLAISESSLQLVGEALDLVNSGGDRAGTGPVDRLLGEIALLRSRMSEAIESVKTVRERIAGAGGEKSLGERMGQATRLAVRVIATLGPIESRLTDIKARLSEIRRTARNANATVRRWTWTAAIVITLLVLWMAAGQFSLCRAGWKGLQRGPANQPPNSGGPEQPPAAPHGDTPLHD